MRVLSASWLCVLALLVVGCRDEPPPSPAPPADREAEIRANLAKLGLEDQRLAEEQMYCPLMESVRLGETGEPCKVTVKGVVFFVCCEGCVQAAEEDPNQALAKFRDLERVRAREQAKPTGNSIVGERPME